MPSEPTIPSIDWVAFGARLAERRRELRLAQDELANAAGISRVQLQNLEHGLADRATRRPFNPRLSNFLAVCRVLKLGVTFDFTQDDDVIIEWTTGGTTSTANSSES